ncbi:Transposon TX1 uncharacterized 82 kDa protein ORF 1 [Takifugu flavidus]|uniref:Transposon TX1 uncharacterized 82 kDa protein ORF 1 n=1 Tax=Takifugu flavidus TaxID=433684 RepID=A0A5C6PDA5_9TELE|nr:Transposon TX1 uncharacterized 82 kDa protein ORF 1 [Takifugu flavidus]
MNRAVVLFLAKVEQVNMLVETGITVGGQFVQVTPLTQPAARITLSNVPPFISDEFLVRELSRHGKVVSPIRKMLSGCKSPLLRHVVSHRRQVHMILNNRAEEFNYRFIVRGLSEPRGLGRAGGGARRYRARGASGPAPFRRRGVGGSARREAPLPGRSDSRVADGGEAVCECVRESEVSGESEIVEMVVEMNGESGESGGKVDLTGEVCDLSGVMSEVVCDLNELGGKGEVMGETVELGETGETGDRIQTGEQGTVGQVMGGLDGPGIVAGERAEGEVSTGERGEGEVSTGERGEGAVSTGEQGEGAVSTGERGEGGVSTGERGEEAVSAGEGTSGASEWWLVPARRRNKRKSAMKDKGGKTGRLEETVADTDTSDCKSMSDGSEIYRLRKHMGKARKQLN